jgi:esterase/lipase
MLPFSFTTVDNITIDADLYPGGSHAVLLAHGKVFDKSSWKDLAATLSDKGYTVLAPDFRGYGKSGGEQNPAGFAMDVAAGVFTLRARGADRVSVIGGSMGAVAAAEAVVSGQVEGLTMLALLAPRTLRDADKIFANHVIFVVSKEEDIAENIESWCKQTSGKTSLHEFDGAAHAQHLFNSEHANDLKNILCNGLREST